MNTEQFKSYLIEGTIIHCKAPFVIETFTNGYLLIENNVIKYLGNEKPKSNRKDSHVKYIKLNKYQFLIPGLIDTHIHAPQYPNIGLGYHLQLLDWLQTYTFPQEVKFSDTEYAKFVYNQIIKRTLQCGTTTASYFATSHLESSEILADLAIKYGQRCLIGFVNMTTNAPNDLIHLNNSISLELTTKFIDTILNKQCCLVKPIITPRFALSCNKELLTELGALAKKYNVHIQTHISENKIEIDETLKLYSDAKSYADIYDQAGLLTNKTILAHAIYLSDSEKKLIASRGTSVAHCPNSNVCLHSGMCDVQNLLANQITVGLGTDVSGGSNPSILDTMRSALALTNNICCSQLQYKPLNYQDVFYLATLGGAKALKFDEVIGNFQLGKEFDALLVDINCVNSPIDVFDDYTPLELLQKFIYCGDDRNICQVFVAGKIVHQLFDI